ncbi:hypothetical protein GXP67_31605 [Rhodocytophaga rosea]|uniref:Luciferase domain-containing protein n=1 Tax=Rhodocytophaga rosea TaxID=2704465 RepID=A0A6C0GTL1_9BACT|nr:luciferase family protein [Rhodocytophaga rosea]QHT67349.1 hypothetical protein GXP67_12245 [Rhodocytophaga rosea]QHT70873.1 hypothetical protein GXP67_31605 [Rhodocytophaga rosea]
MKLLSPTFLISLTLFALPYSTLQAQKTNSKGKLANTEQKGVDLSYIQSQLTEEEYKEFQNWVALGVGGLPHTVEGFRTLQNLNKKLRDPLDISHLTSKMGKSGDVQTLKNLPKRNGKRPTIAPFAIPHRQMDQHNSDLIRQKQKTVFEQIVGQNKGVVHFQKSYFEKHNEAVFLNDSTKSNQSVVLTTHGEVGHMHPSDGSMHFSLSPSDTKEVLAQGWGELHGLAGQVYKENAALPATYLMVYSPRTEGELAVVKQILQAAIHYSSLQEKRPTNAK